MPKIKLVINKLDEEESSKLVQAKSGMSVIHEEDREHKTEQNESYINYSNMTQSPMKKDNKVQTERDSPNVNDLD